MANNIKRSATYQGNNLTNVYTPSQLSAKIKLQDFSGVNIGDYFEITLTNGEETIIEVSGFNVNIMQGDNELVNTSPHITMTFRDCLQTTYQMNATATNTGGYAESALDATVNSTIFNLLPVAWKSIVMPTRRILTGKGTWLERTRNMWIPTENEVFGGAHWSEPGYGCGQLQLPIFAYSTRHIVKGLGKNSSKNGSASAWWLSAPSAQNNTHFCNVGIDGSPDARGATAYLGVAPAFNIY